MLSRYSGYLSPDGVFIARIFVVSGKLHTLIDTVETGFDVLENHLQKSRVCMIMFRPFPTSA
jgi:hypothetical protein